MRFSPTAPRATMPRFSAFVIWLAFIASIVSVTALVGATNSGAESPSLPVSETSPPVLGPAVSIERLPDGQPGPFIILNDSSQQQKAPSLATGP